MHTDAGPALTRRAERGYDGSPSPLACEIPPVRIACLVVAMAVAALAEADPRVAELIAQLFDADAARREAAQVELERLGAEDTSGDVERAVEEAARSADAEVASRCTAALRAMRPWENLALVAGFGSVQAIDVEAGAIAWTRPGPAEAWVGARVRGCRAYVAPADGGLECRDLRTGAGVWALGGKPLGQPTGVGAWVGEENGRIICASLDTGDIAWSREGRFEVEPPRVVDIASNGNRVFVQTTEGPLALDARTGEWVWGVPDAGAAFQSFPGAVYVFTPCGSGEAEVEGRDPASGVVQWRTIVHGPSGLSIKRDPRGAGRVVLAVCTFVGGTTALEARNGASLWTSLAPRIPLFYEQSGDHAWVEDHDLRMGSDLCRIDLRTGGLDASESMAGSVLACLEDADDVYFVAGTESPYDVRALDRRSGRCLWEAHARGVGEEEGIRFPHEWTMERVGARLLLVDKAAGVTALELLDPATGDVVARQLLK